MRRYRVRVTAEAVRDLHDIGDYVARNDSPAKAPALMDEIERVCAGLAVGPGRGHVPPEMRNIGIEGYRETHCHGYRIVYECGDGDVFIYAIVDGRRDLQSFLERRLLRP